MEQLEIHQIRRLAFTAGRRAFIQNGNLMYDDKLDEARQAAFEQVATICGAMLDGVMDMETYRNIGHEVAGRIRRQHERAIADEARICEVRSKKLRKLWVRANDRRLLLLQIKRGCSPKGF